MAKRLKTTEGYSELSHYQSSSESEDEQEQPGQRKRKPKRQRSWDMKQTFPSKDAAILYVASEACWSIDKTNHTQAGTKVLYRCKKVKRRGVQCDAGLYLLYDASSLSVHLYRTSADHNCSTLDQATQRLPDAMKAEIETLYKVHRTKPKRIFEMLKEKGFTPKSVMQISNFLQNMKKNEYGPASISLGSLEEWCQQHCAPPQDEDDAFVVDYCANYPDDDNDASFRLVISTPRLLAQSALASHVHCDATYKLNWEGCPVLIVGTSDKDRHFVPICLAVCSDEQAESFQFIFASLQRHSDYAPSILIADASLAIQNAFRSVFGEHSTLVMCWAHMRKNVVKHLSLATLTAREELISDLDFLQVSMDKEAFSKGLQLFKAKWSASEPDFLDYLEIDWFTTHLGWYEMHAPGVPSTNNALESFNATIKREETLRERMPLSQFLPLCLESSTRWSEPYGEDKQIAATPTYTLADWTDAYAWVKLNKTVTVKEQADTTMYICPGNDKLTVTNADVQRVLNRIWNKFDLFKRRSTALWIVTITGDNWQEGTCTCPKYQKTFKCKHIMGVALRQKYAQAPAAAKNVPIGQKRKRGRPKKATKVLIVD